jgi:hypothetical protein
MRATDGHRYGALARQEPARVAYHDVTLMLVQAEVGK